MDLALLLIRLAVGLTLAVHGTQKLFGWFGGYGPKGTGGWMESIGMKPGVAMAVLAGLMELVGGLLFAAGVLTAVGGILIALTMVVAILKVHGRNGYFADKGGFEYAFILLVVAVAVAIAGPGDYALWG